MHFGVTVLPDPPYTDLVRLFKQAEDNVKNLKGVLEKIAEADKKWEDEQRRLAEAAKAAAKAAAIAQRTALVEAAETLAASTQWKATGEMIELPAKTICVAAGTSPNVTYEKERPGTFDFDKWKQFFQAHKATRDADGFVRAIHHLLPPVAEKHLLSSAFAAPCGQPAS